MNNSIRDAFVMLDDISEMALVLDKNYEVVYINNQVLKHLSITSNQILGKNINKMLSFGSFSMSNLVKLNFKINYEKDLNITFSAKLKKLSDGTKIYLLISKNVFDDNIPEVLSSKYTLQKIVFDISQKFISSPIDIFADSINWMLSTISKYLKIERSYIFEIDKNQEFMSLSFNWSMDESEIEISKMQNLDCSRLSPWFQKLKSSNPIIVNDIDSINILIPSANKIKDFFKVESLIAVPIFSQDQLLGFIGFDSIRSNITWSDETTHLLMMIGQITSNFYARVKIENSLSTVIDIYQTIFETTSAPTFILSEDNCITKYNKQFANFTNLSSNEILDAHQWLKFIYPDDIEKILNIRAQRLADSDNTIRQYEFRVINSKHGIRHVISTSDMIKSTNDTVISFTDITELKEHQIELENILNETVLSLCESFAYIDPYTVGHHKKVMKLAVEIALEMDLNEEEVKCITFASLLHDIGKVYVPQSILSKPSILTENEFNLIKEHPQIGYNITKNISFPWNVSKMILDHHERLDGSGYPNSLIGDEISIGARIIAVADVVDAMLSHRPYRAALDYIYVIEELEKNAGITYDETVIDICINLLPKYKTSL